MGPVSSTADPREIANVSCRKLFELMSDIAHNVPKSQKYGKKVKHLLVFIFEELKRVPAADFEFDFVIPGLDLGPPLVDLFLPNMIFPDQVTKLCFRKSGLKPLHAMKLADLIMNMHFLKQFDASENDFGDNAEYLIRATVAHKSMISFLIEDCNVNILAVESIRSVLKFNRNMETLRILPLNINENESALMMVDIQNNLNLTNLSMNDFLDPITSYVTARNSFIGEFVDSFSRAPFQGHFKTKISPFKDASNSKAYVDREQTIEFNRRNESFSNGANPEKKLKKNDTCEPIKNFFELRSGVSEMCGRRPSMEDVTIILESSPTLNSCLFGVFDGHGGREAAEYASINLPEVISQFLGRGDQPSDAYANAFRKVHEEMKSWCSYVGCTVCIAVIEDNALTVTNVGDTRCILCRSGKAIRLTQDHKPDLPEETAYIHDKGGFVRDGRVGGMLAISRALGDGYFGDCINPTPHFTIEQLTPEDQFFIIACDGVWDVISDQKACDIVLSSEDPLVAARILRDTAFELDSTDNISIIVVFLTKLSS